MNVRGILIEGKDGREYLLGFGQRAKGKTTGPTVKRRREDGVFVSLEETREASGAIREQFDLPLPTGWTKLPAGWGHDEYAKLAFVEAISQLLWMSFEKARWGG